jgi:Ca2+-transporting ATPase
VTRNGGIRVVHGRVPGRLRLEIPGLRYDSARLRQLTDGLSAVPSIHTITGNVRTGRVLIVFARDRDPSEIVGLVERAWLGAPLPGRADRGSGVPDPWHRREPDDVVSALAGCAERGLSTEEAGLRLRQHGPNSLAKARPRSDQDILLDQFKGLPAVFLLASTGLSLVTGGVLDAAAIAFVTAVNAAIGFTTEREAERTITSLAERGPRRASVLRDGTPQDVLLDSVVPGDILVLKQGLLVPADGRLIEASGLAIDESLLTGESLPAQKRTAAISRTDLSVGELQNMVFKGTAVTGGEGRAIAVATGNRTEIGRIQALTAGTRPPQTPLERQLDRLSRDIAIASGGVFAAMVVLGMVRGQGLLALLKSAVSLGVAALPEGLPTVATVTLALGIREMRRHKVIVRQLKAVETLGSVTTLCLDKTGTLTQNRMAVAALACDGAPILRRAAFEELAVAVDPALLERLVAVAVLCNDSVAETGDTDGARRLRGSATETALLQVALDFGFSPARLRRDWPLVNTRHRTHERLYMETLHRRADGTRLRAIKGSPEQVAALCRRRLEDGRTVALTPADQDRVLAANRILAAQGLRVLGFATERSDDPEPGLCWLGLIGLEDPLRPGMRQVIAGFHDAGIRTVMITGDQTATAYALARELDLAKGGSVEILEGPQLAETDPAVLSALAARTHIFARVSPEYKLQIVEALQRAGEVVAMTGDGINDTPALRRADIGVAMGSGADSAHEVADLVLRDDRLETMAIAVARGRTIYRNVRRSVRFLLSTNLSEVTVMLGGTALGLSAPLSPMQLLWINLVTDVLPGLALGLEPPHRDVLRQPPRHRDERIVDAAARRRILKESSVISGWSMASYLAGRILGGTSAGSGWAFTTLTVAQLLHAFSSRSADPLWSTDGLRRNRQLEAASAGLLALQMMASLVPGLRTLLGLEGMRAPHLLAAGGLSVASFLTQEALKARPAAGPKAPLVRTVRLTREDRKEARP